MQLERHLQQPELLQLQRLAQQRRQQLPLIATAAVASVASVSGVTLRNRQNVTATNNTMFPPPIPNSWNNSNSSRSPIFSASPQSLGVQNSLVSRTTKPLSVCKNQEHQFKNGHAKLEFEGATRLLSNQEALALGNSFRHAYNLLSPGCLDIYQRFLHEANLITQSTFLDDFGE
jgi:hypothetical protein